MMRAKDALAFLIVLPLLPFILMGELMGWALARTLPGYWAKKEK